MNDNINQPVRVTFTFFGITYLFSWTMFALGYFSGFMPVILLGIYGPSLASVYLNYRYSGKRGVATLFGRFKRWKFGWLTWLLLLTLPGIVHYVGRSLWQVAFAEYNPFFWFSVSTTLSSFLIAGFGEELGWRGFALPRLQKKFSPLKASLILATAHFFWHLPTYWLGQGIHNVPMIYALAFIIPWTIIFTWIYNRSGGSMIVAVAFHAISNSYLAFVRFMPLDSQLPISPGLITMFQIDSKLGGPYLAVVTTYWLFAIFLVLSGGMKKRNTDIP